MSRHRGGLAAAVVAAWGDLRGSIAARIAARPRDAELLVWALVAALIGFVAGLPEALRQAATMESRDVATGVVATRLFGAVFFWPLFLFLLAALSHLVARLFGGEGSFWSARVALAWAVLVCVPLVLLNGLASALLPAQAVSVVSLVTLAGFAWVWAVFLSVVENFGKIPVVFAILCALPTTIAIILSFFSS